MMTSTVYGFWGKLDLSDSAWENWINDGIALCDSFGYPINHYQVSANENIDDKYRPIGGMNRRINNLKKKGFDIKCVTLLTLPPKYGIINKDTDDFSIMYENNYNIIYLERFALHYSKYEYVSFSVDDRFNVNYDEDIVIDFLKRHISAERGEKVQLDRIFPLSYMTNPDEYLNEKNEYMWRIVGKVIGTPTPLPI